MFFIGPVFSQNIWSGSTNNNWNTGSNWSLNHVPTSGEDVVININASILVDNSSTINSLTISNSATVSFTSSGGGRTITIGNTGSSIGGGGTLTLQGSTGSGTRSMTLNFTGGGSRTMSIAGTLVLTAVGEGTIYDATNSLTTVTGTLRNDGTGGATSGVITSTASNLSFSSGGTYQHAINGGNIPTATWDAASTCLITGATSTAPGGYNQAFGNFTWNCNQTTYLSLGGAGSSNATTSILGNLTVMATGNSP